MKDINVHPVKKYVNTVKRPFKKLLAPETQITKYGKWYSIVPLTILSVGLVLALIGIFVAPVGLNLGLDFTGGRIIKVTGISDANYAETRTVVRDVLQEELGRGVANRAFFQREQSDLGGMALTARYAEPKGNEEKVNKTNDTIRREIETRLANKGIHVVVEEADSISGTASRDRMLNVFIAVFATLIVTLLYMLFRFKFTSGVAAIIGLFHDVAIMLACVIIFRIQINFIFVAALITVVAYSLNNTLVLFDRVRDKEKDVTNKQTPAQRVDASIKETFWRTSITTITTLVPVIILVIFGVPLIREFALPIIFGLLAGTYSTLCITSSLYVRFENAKAAKAKLKAKRKNV